MRTRFFSEVQNIWARYTEPDRSKVVRVIHDWYERHGLPRLDITNVKNLAMSELWENRAVQVAMNTGRRADGR